MSELISDPDNETIVVLKSIGREVRVMRSGKRVTKMEYLDDPSEDVESNGWFARIEDKKDRQKRWLRRNRGESLENAPSHYKPRAVLYQRSFSGLLQGNLGNSVTYGDSVVSMIKERVPIALFFGLISAALTYAVCLPLGIVKAIRHRTALDNMSSLLIFAGYSVPGFALGAVLVVFLGARWGFFPLQGLDSPELAEMSWWEFARIKDRLHHSVLPLFCYVVGSFAFLTMMMKNNLMDNLAADYVRTAVAKGVKYRSAVFKHAFRNSIIPVASTLGQIITVLVSGSILIESIFDIKGFGLLQFDALKDKDTPIIMGTLTISALLLLIGNILSDFIVAMIDPRVKFN